MVPSKRDYNGSHESVLRSTCSPQLLVNLPQFPVGIQGTWSGNALPSSSSHTSVDIPCSKSAGKTTPSVLCTAPGKSDTRVAFRYSPFWKPLVTETIIRCYRTQHRKRTGDNKIRGNRYLSVVFVTWLPISYPDPPVVLDRIRKYTNWLWVVCAPFSFSNTCSFPKLLELLTMDCELTDRLPRINIACRRFPKHLRKHISSSWNNQHFKLSERSKQYMWKVQFSCLVTGARLARKKNNNNTLWTKLPRR